MIRSTVVFKHISDFNGLYINKNRKKKKEKRSLKKERKRSLVLADSNVTDSFVYNTAVLLRKIMLRIKADGNIC